MLYIERDDDAGCHRLIDDDYGVGVGLCISKSRNVLVRIRDALNAVNKTGLVGLTVEHVKDTIPNRVEGNPRGVVLALTGGPPQFVVRLADGRLDAWTVTDCRIAEPVRPEKDTPSNEPTIGVHAACVLLKRWATIVAHFAARFGLETDVDVLQLTVDTETFLKARADSEPTP